MSLFRKIRVLFICWHLAGFTGIRAYFKAVSNLRHYVNSAAESSVFSGGDLYV